MGFNYTSKSRPICTLPGSDVLWWFRSYHELVRESIMVRVIKRFVNMPVYNVYVSAKRIFFFHERRLYKAMQ